MLWPHSHSELAWCRGSRTDTMRRAPFPDAPSLAIPNPNTIAFLHANFRAYGTL
jgi:hypothetical protein